MTTMTMHTTTMTTPLRPGEDTRLGRYELLGRLGQGGGYYDRTFAARPDVTRIGFAYTGQEVADLPSEPHDIRLHGVLTETGYRPFA